MQKLRPRHATATQSRVLAMQAAELPSARREVEGVRDIYGAAHTQVYTPARSGEEHLRRDSSRATAHVSAFPAALRSTQTACIARRK